MTEPVSKHIPRSSPEAARPKATRPKTTRGATTRQRLLVVSLVSGMALFCIAIALVLIVLFGQPTPAETPEVASAPAEVESPPVAAPTPILEVILPRHDPSALSPNAVEPDPMIPAPVPAPMPTDPAIRPAPADPAPAIGPAPVVRPNPAPVMPVADESKTQRIAFLGTVAEGRRFFFIADNSGSMKGVKMAMLKNELALTLKSLRPESQFFITFFNSEAHPLPAKDWQRGERDVPKALQWVAAMGTGGDTNPQSAFDQAFAARPRPDAILFMTDGQIPAHIPARLRKLNAQEPKVVIHTLLLEARNPQGMAAGLMGADLLLKQIAADSGGTYRQVVIPLPPNPVVVRPPVMVRPPLPIRRP